MYFANNNRYSISLIWVICLFLTSMPVQGSEPPFFTLYGFKIGQKMDVVRHELGKEDKLVSFDDGWKAYVYFRDGHNIIFETDNSGSDVVMTIQIQGNTNPQGKGLAGINLGDNSSPALKKLGKETLSRPAVDLASGEPVPGATIYYYGYHLSVEVNQDKISSIKVVYSQPVQLTDKPEVEKFIHSAKENDLYGLSESISIYLTINGKPVIENSMMTELKTNELLEELLFGEAGIASLSWGMLTDINLRVNIGDEEKNFPGSTGYVYKFDHEYIRELYFVRSYEGWVLLDALVF